MKKHIFNNQNKDVNGINITVIGLGKSGQGAAKLANYLGASVFVSDAISNSDLKEKSNYLESVINLIYKKEFYLEDKIKNKNLLIDDIDIGPIKSNFSLFVKDNNIVNTTFFTDSSIALLSNDKFSLVLMPNIAEVDFYLKNKYNNNYLSKFISFLIKQQSNNSPINLRLDKNNYLKGEKISFDNL